MKKIIYVSVCLILFFAGVGLVSAYDIFDVDMDESYSLNWRDPSYAIDENNNTYSMLRDTYNGDWLYLNTTERTVYVYGVRILADITNIGGSNINFTIEYYDVDSLRYETYYDGILNDNSWTYINVSPVDSLLCHARNWRITTDELGSRGYVWIYEFDLIHASDGLGNYLPSGLNLPDDGVYGLNQYIGGSWKDSTMILDTVTSYIYLKGIDNDTWWCVNESSGLGSATFYYGGSYFRKYGIEYTYSINNTDDYNTPCENNWYNKTYSFTILPVPLDKEDANDTLPFEGDCWEMVSIPCNVSKYDVMIYNISDSSWKTWNDSKGSGHFDGVFWWNSSNSSYDNMTDFEMFKGYWVYFYDNNLTVRYNCTPDCPECNSTALTHYENIVNATGTLESVYDSVTGWRVWANYTGNTTALSLHENIIGATGTHESRLSGSGYDVWANYTGSGGSFPLYFNLSNDNITVNITVSGETTADITNHTVNETSWLFISGLSLEPSVMLLVFVGFFFFFASKREDTVLYFLTCLISLIGGVYYLGWEVAVTDRVLGISLILFSIYCSFLALMNATRLKK